MTILALYSNKGGVGKTTAAVNISYLAARSGMQTLLCDLDPQSSATYYFRVEPQLRPKVRGFVKTGKRIRKSIKGTDYPHLDLLPADFTHRNLDITFFRLKQSKMRLRKVLEPLEDEYELIILDCLATINILAENIFNAADYILVPIIPTMLSLRTHRQLVRFLEDNEYNMSTLYTFLSMIDRTKRMHRNFEEEARMEFNGVLNNVIPYLSLVEWMGIERQPLPAFAPISSACNFYFSLWEEVQERILNQRGAT